MSLCWVGLRLQVCLIPQTLLFPFYHTALHWATARQTSPSDSAKEINKNDRYCYYNTSDFALGQMLCQKLYCIIVKLQKRNLSGSNHYSHVTAMEMEDCFSEVRQGWTQNLTSFTKSTSLLTHTNFQQGSAGAALYSLAQGPRLMEILPSCRFTI